MIKPHGSTELDPRFVYDSERHHALLREAESLPSLLVKTFTFKQIWVYNDDENAGQQGFTVATPFPEFP